MREADSLIGNWLSCTEIGLVLPRTEKRSAGQETWMVDWGFNCEISFVWLHENLPDLFFSFMLNKNLWVVFVVLAGSRLVYMNAPVLRSRWTKFVVKKTSHSNHHKFHSSKKRFCLLICLHNCVSLPLTECEIKYNCRYTETMLLKQLLVCSATTSVCQSRNDGESK